MIDSWRWQGVPFYIRAGKSLPVTCTEVVARLRKPPVHSVRELRAELPALSDQPDGGDRHRTQRDGCAGDRRRRDGRAHGAAAMPGRTNAMPMSACWVMPWCGDRTLFAREDYVEEAWRIVDPVLGAATPIHFYEPGTWGPAQAAAVAPPGGWVNPIVSGEGR